MLGFFSCVWYNRIACFPFFSIQFTGEMFSEVIDRPQTVNDLLQLRLERGAVQLLRATGPPCMPELVAAAPEVHTDMSNGTQPLIFFGVRGIK